MAVSSKCLFYPDRGNDKLLIKKGNFLKHIYILILYHFTRAMSQNLKYKGHHMLSE